MAEEKRYHVYVIRLDDAVLQEPKFAAANPQHVPGKPCVYVGMTGLSPDERFENHKRGHKANRYVKKYGLYLMRRKFRHLNPLTYEAAQELEVQLAERLRRRGFAVWQR